MAKGRHRDVDELFGGGDGAPEPKVRLAMALAITGLLVAIIGLACLSAPGGLLVLLGLWQIERELDRVENGYLAEDARPTVEGARKVVFACLALTIGVFIVQAFLYCGGFYQQLGDWVFGSFTL